MFFEFLGLDEEEPTGSWHIARQVPAARHRPVDHAQVDRFPLPKAPLARHLEASDRLDVVTEELHADRVVPVGREEVDDSAPVREFARQFHRRDVLEAVFHQPPR